MKCLKALCCLLFALSLSAHQPPHEIRPSVRELPRDVKTLPVVTGDLIFRRGRSLNSRAVLLADQASRFSHVGIVIETPHGLRVVHTVPPEGDAIGGIRVDAIEVFLARTSTSDWGVFRLRRTPSEHQASTAARPATAARAAAAMAEEGFHFDGAFDLANDRKLYCTELVWKAYQATGIDLVDGRFDTLKFPLFAATQVILPSRLQKSPHLQQVFFPEDNQERSQ